MVIKTVLITGASRGIGSATAHAFAKAGYSVIINYNRSETQAEELASKLNKTYGVKCRAVKADVSNPDEVKAMFEEVGSVDVLVNNAGISSQKLFTDITDDEWKRTIGVNLDGVFYCCRNALPYMIRQKSGAIINIGSMWGEVGASCEVHYSASKAGVIGLTKALAKEVAPSGVRVNCIAPGVVMTDMMSDFDDTTIEELKDETPLGRLGNPEDIAAAVLFLASDDASFITGQTLGVNGGFII
ncbi:MAG: SDR family oxidoreductase [Ruminococcus sp.]|nr:SDR family oxidoreductase [Ruminococcus sp.]